MTHGNPQAAQAARLQIGLWVLSIALSGITAMVSVWTRAAVAETEVKILREMNQQFVRRPEFMDVRDRLNAHCEQEGNRHAAN